MGKSQAKRIMTTNHVTRKDFKYEEDGVTLSFSLRVDVKKELAAFEELLIAALKDVQAELAK